jgi:hypothetical protein
VSPYRSDWRPCRLNYKNPRNGQKCICKYVSSLDVDFQDGFVCEYIILIIFRVSSIFSERMRFGLMEISGSGLVMPDVQKP